MQSHAAKLISLEARTAIRAVISEFKSEVVNLRCWLTSVLKAVACSIPQCPPLMSLMTIFLERTLMFVHGGSSSRSRGLMAGHKDAYQSQKAHL